MGSEMCIRDRGDGVRSFIEGGGERRVHVVGGDVGPTAAQLELRLSLIHI